MQIDLRESWRHKFVPEIFPFLTVTSE